MIYQQLVCQHDRIEYYGIFGQTDIYSDLIHLIDCFYDFRKITYLNESQILLINNKKSQPHWITHYVPGIVVKCKGNYYYPHFQENET